MNFSALKKNDCCSETGTYVAMNTRIRGDVRDDSRVDDMRTRHANIVG